jgi:hypothetical protein
LKIGHASSWLTVKDESSGREVPLNLMIAQGAG